MAIHGIPDIPVFEGLTLAQLEELNEWIVRREFEPGSAILTAHAPEDGLYIVSRGRATIMLHTQDGAMKIGVVEGPTVIGELGLLSRQPRVASVLAETAVLAGQLPAVTVQQRLDANCPIAFRIIFNLGRLASLRMRATIERITDFARVLAESSNGKGDTEILRHKLEELSFQLLKKDAR